MASPTNTGSDASNDPITRLVNNRPTLTVKRVFTGANGDNPKTVRASKLPGSPPDPGVKGYGKTNVRGSINVVKRVSPLDGQTPVNLKIDANQNNSRVRAKILRTPVATPVGSRVKRSGR